MFLNTEKVVSYPKPERPDFTSIRKSVARGDRKLLTASLGREFMELSTKHKLYGAYAIVSLMAPITFSSENYPWLMLPLVANLANAIRLANKIEKEKSNSMQAVLLASDDVTGKLQCRP